MNGLIEIWSIVLFILLGCVATFLYSKYRERTYRIGLRLLDDYMNGSGADSQNILSSIESLRLDVIKYKKEMISKFEIEAQERHTDLAFRFAQGALSKACLNDADLVYRGLIEFYVGLLHTGIRDRATIGVEDIREARKQETTREGRQIA